MQQILDLWKFLISGNSAGIATLATGFTALLIYLLQKRDKKINAARILLSEIRLAEQREELVKNLVDRNVKEYPKILPANSWNKYSYLFAPDFNQDQLDEINNFYSTCEQIDEVTRKDDNYFWLQSEGVLKEGQEKAADLIIKSLKDDNSVDEEKLKKLQESILKEFEKRTYTYAPQKTLTLINNYLTKFQKLTTAPTGLKLIQIARLSKRKSIVELLLFDLKP